MRKQINKLVRILGISSFDGSVAIAALTGFFKPGNIIIIALIFLAGPAAIITATLLEGGIKERVIVALIAGLISTTIVMLAAGMGPKLLGHLNLKIIKAAGAIAVGIIALTIAGLKVPDKIPLGVMIVGIVLGIIIK